MREVSEHFVDEDYTVKTHKMNGKDSVNGKQQVGGFECKIHNDSNYSQ